MLCHLWSFHSFLLVQIQNSDIPILSSSLVKQDYDVRLPYKLRESWKQVELAEGQPEPPNPASPTWLILTRGGQFVRLATWYPKEVGTFFFIGRQRGGRPHTAEKLLAREEEEAPRSRGEEWLAWLLVFRRGEKSDMPFLRSKRRKMSVQCECVCGRSRGGIDPFRDVGWT